MLSLKSQADIRELFQQGRRLSGKYCLLVWEISEASRFGIFLSKAHGKAAGRNRIKRHYREAVRLNRHLLSRPVRIAITPHVSVQQPAFAEITDDIQGLFRQINDQLPS